MVDPNFQPNIQVVLNLNAMKTFFLHMSSWVPGIFFIPVIPVLRDGPNNKTVPKRVKELHFVAGYNPRLSHLYMVVS